MFIIVDIDGTIADCSHRLHLIEGNTDKSGSYDKKKDWDSFHKACINDKPIERIIGVVNMLSQFHEIVYCTGRSERARELTKEWLSEHNCNDSSNLLMRKEGDYRPDYIVKPELLEKYLKDNNKDKTDVLCIFEDRASVTKRWRELGYTCLQVAEGDF